MVNRWHADPRPTFLPDLSLGAATTPGYSRLVHVALVLRAHTLTLLPGDGPETTFRANPAQESFVHRSMAWHWPLRVLSTLQEVVVRYVRLDMSVRMAGVDKQL